jgi:hypothetical protein
MSLLGRFKVNRSEDPHFWRTSPLDTRDVTQLHDHGIMCASQQDGPAMMRIGWALWSLTGSVHERHAYHFLYDGFRLWSNSPGHEARLESVFLGDLFDRLADSDPPIPGDIWRALPQQVQPVSIYYGARCWAGSELVSRGAGDAEKIYDAIARTNVAFVPPRSMAWAKSYAERQGRLAPWGDGGNEDV